MKCENDLPKNDSHSFSKKEIAVIGQLLEGKSNKQIALQLGITTRAVEYHLTHIYKQLGVSGRTAAIMKLAGLFEK